MSFICKLCNKESNEKIKSHIWPAFFFEERDNEIFRGFKLTDKGLENGKVPSNGFYQYDFLCGGCEQLIGKYDSYAKKFFIDRAGHDLTANKLLVQDFRYRVFKLFVLSVIWRISSCNKLGALSVLKFSLGNIHAEKIRSMLLLQEAGETFDYPVYIRKNTIINAGVLFEPSKDKIIPGCNINFVVLDIKDFLLIVKVDSRNYFNAIIDTTLLLKDEVTISIPVTNNPEHLIPIIKSVRVEERIKNGNKKLYFKQ